MENRNYTKGIFYLFCFIASIVALTVLKVTTSFVLPLTFAILFSFIFTCAKIASYIKGKSTEEIRERFHIENDFSPEEEARVFI